MIIVKVAMNDLHLYTQLLTLPDDLKQEVEDFILFLKSKTHKKEIFRQRQFGAAKGFFKMRDDFDEPLEDFKEYMQ